MSREFNAAQRVLFKHIAGNIKSNCDDYRNAGKWLDRYYDDHELCWQKYKRELVSEISKRKRKPALTDCDKSILHEDEEHLENIQKYKIESRVPLRLRLSYALEDLWLDYRSGNTLQEDDARATLIIAWLASDPDAHKLSLKITKFESIPWKKEEPRKGPSRRGWIYDILLDRRPCSFGSQFFDNDNDTFLKFIFTAWGILFSGTIEGAIIIKEMKRAIVAEERLFGIDKQIDIEAKSSFAQNQILGNLLGTTNIKPEKTAPEIKSNGNKRTGKRGRPPKYTDALLEAGYKAYEKFYGETNDSAGAWSEAAKIINAPTGGAARKACTNYQKKKKLEKST